MGAPKSYRPVMLLSAVRKVLTRIITMRSQQPNVTTSYVRESQADFTPTRSTADGVSILVSCANVHYLVTGNTLPHY